MSTLHKRGFSSLPQEITDRIFEFYHEQNHYHFSYQEEYTRHGVSEWQPTLADRTVIRPTACSINKQLLTSSRRAYELTPVDLDITRDKTYGFSALHSLLTDHQECIAFRDRVVSISIGNLQLPAISSSFVKHEFELITSGFKNLEEITINYKSYRYPYCATAARGLSNHTVPLPPIDLEKHRNGGYDDELMVPVEGLAMASLLTTLEAQGKSAVKVYLDHCCSWNKESVIRVLYCLQVCFYHALLTTGRELIYVTEDQIPRHERQGDRCCKDCPLDRCEGTVRSSQHCRYTARQEGIDVENAQILECRALRAENILGKNWQPHLDPAPRALLGLRL